MSRPLCRQLWEMLTGFAAGGGLGLFYELLGPLFTAPRRAVRLAAQMVYLLISFAWVFLAGQLGGRGTPPLYLLLCAAGWCLSRFLMRFPGRSGRGRTLSKNR